MKFKGGKEAVPTWSGLVCSILLLAMMLMYSYQKLENLIYKKDAKIFSTEQIGNIKDTEVFDTKMGLKIAVAVTNYDTDPEPILDETFGRIVFIKSTWGRNADGTLFLSKDEIPSHYCTEEELGLED